MSIGGQSVKDVILSLLGGGGLLAGASGLIAWGSLSASVTAHDMAIAELRRSDAKLIETATRQESISDQLSDLRGDLGAANASIGQLQSDVRALLIELRAAKVDRDRDRN